MEKYNNSLLKKDKWSNFPQETNSCNNDELGISGKCLSYPTKCETTEEILKFDPNRYKRLNSSEKKEVSIGKI